MPPSPIDLTPLRRALTAPLVPDLSFNDLLHTAADAGLIDDTPHTSRR
ncbi:hypothetical protein [Tepidimonas sp. HKU79]